MKVILAEKPDMGENIAKALGVAAKKRGHILLSNGDVVTWGIGHLIRLKSPDSYEKYKEWTWHALPVIPEQMETEVDPKKEDQYNIVASLLEKSDECILATDPDREGEYIGRLILSQCGYKKKIKRLWIDDLTEQTIRAGMQKLRPAEEFVNLGAAAQVRAYADYWLGFTASRFFSLLTQDVTGSKVNLSAGRVQTPTLRLVYDRENEMDNFVPESFHNLSVTFQSERGQYKGQWFKVVEDKKSTRFSDSAAAEAMKQKVNGMPGVVLSFETKDIARYAPQLLNSSALKTASRKQLKFSTVKTTQVLQALYDKGYVSYPRADSRHLSVNKAKELLDDLRLLQKSSKYAQLFPAVMDTLVGKSQYVDDKKAATHHAIVPTNNDPHQSDEASEDELKLYELILRHTLAAFHERGTDRETEVITEVARETFITRSMIVVTAGWRKLFKTEEDENLNENEIAPSGDKVPGLEKGYPVRVEQAALNKGQTTKPKRLNDDELEVLMKNAGHYVDESIDDEVLEKIQEKGIGTAATRTNIVQSLVQREYIEIKKNLVYLTNKGRSFMSLVYEHPIASIELTGSFEKKLGDVEKGINSAAALQDEFKSLAHAVMNDKASLENRIRNQSLTGHAFNNVQEIGNCPQCKKAVIETKNAYSCSARKEGCSFSIWKEYRNTPIKLKHAKELLVGKEVLLENIPAAEGKQPYNIYIKLDDGKFITRFPTLQDKSIGECPQCKKPVIETKNGYSCSAWKEGCNFSIWKEFRKIELSSSVIAKLLKGKEVLLSDLPKKDGGTYGVVLFLKDGKLDSRFPVAEDTSLGKCPVCGKPVQELEKLYGCSAWREGCSFKISKQILGVDIMKVQLKKMLKQGKTDKLEGFKGPNSVFDACLAYSIDKNKITFVSS